MTVGYNPSTSISNLAFCTDAFNSKSYSVNVFGKPLDVFNGWNTSVGGVNCTCIRDTTVTDSPAGGIPMKMTVTGNDPYYNSYNGAQFNIAPAVQGQTWTVSAWVKADRATYAQLFMMAANSSGSYLDAVATNTNIGTTWTRISATYTLPNATTAFVQCRLDGPDTATVGTVVWWDGVQVERASSPSTFNPVRNLNNITLNNISTASIGTSGATFGQTTIYNSSGYVQLDATLNSVLTTTGITYPSTWAQPVSYEMWVYFDGDGTWSNGLNGGLFSRGSTIGTLGLARNITNNSVRMWIRSDLGATAADVTITRDTWCHIVGTWDGLGTVAIYLNGVGVSQPHVATGAPDVGEYSIGGLSSTLSGGPGNVMKGRISVAKVYDKVLSQAEILQNYNALRGRYNI